MPQPYVFVYMWYSKQFAFHSLQRYLRMQYHTRMSAVNSAVHFSILYEITFLQLKKAFSHPLNDSGTLFTKVLQAILLCFRFLVVANCSLQSRINLVSNLLIGSMEEKGIEITGMIFRRIWCLKTANFICFSWGFQKGIVCNVSWWGKF